MSIWSHLGREVVGNLTTVTSCARGVTTLLLGLYYAEVLQDTARDEKPSLLETFLKVEQMAGYARVKAYGDASVRASATWATPMARCRDGGSRRDIEHSKRR